jgi:6-phospho-beta-glucosidase
MKVAVIGGAGVRTPLLVRGLAQSSLPIDEIGLYDSDLARLAVVAPLARSYAPCVRAFADARDCVRDAAFVFLSIRAGGIESRARDEAACIALGVVGQETVGPAGFAMAMRNVPPAVAYARLVARVAPQAWIVNFTNPVGIVTQAMTRDGSARTIGICDTPTELFEETAHALDLRADGCTFDYFGLNHLGWLREVYADGEAQLPRIWDSSVRLARVYRTPLFAPEFLRELRLLPTEYLFYYYQPRAALQNMTAAGRTRGGDIAALNEHLFRDLERAGLDAPRVYEAYLAERSAGYMQLEAGRTGTPATSGAADSSGETGYDRIAVAVVGAIHFNTDAVIPLNVINASTLNDLEDSDIVEVPCAVNADGARPLPVAPMPSSARDLVVRVKEYERLTVAAATSPSTDAAVRALTAHPLVETAALARRLADVLQPLW